MPKRFWLMKSEPSTFSIEDLKKSPKKRTAWEGVRNYQARNLLRDDLKSGDGVLFYHSSCDPQAVVGTAIVVKEGYPDPSQFDPSSKYYDPTSNPEDPRWFLVDIQLEEMFPRPVTLKEMRKMPPLKGMLLLKRGMRLSVQPVTSSEFKFIVAQGSTKK